MRYQFFDGLNANDLQITLDEYCNTPRGVTWLVDTMGENANGFWVLLKLVKS